jgi:photosystem II stability/assembly factor-like uncharacterized protein
VPPTSLRHHIVRFRTIAWRAGASLGAAIAVTIVAILAGPSASALPGPVRWLPSLPVQPQGFLSLDLFPDGTGYVMRTNAADRLFLRTDDMGLTYTPATMPPFNGTGQVDFASPELGYGFDLDTVVYRTEDGTESWTTLAAPQVDDAPLVVTAVRAVVGTDLVAAAGTTSTGGAAVAISVDRGVTWEPIELGYTGSVWRTTFLDADRGLVLGSRDGVGYIAHVVHLVERDVDGRLRAREIHDCAPADACLSIAMTEEAVFIGDRNGTVLRSTDSGRTFTHTPLPGLVPPTDLPGATWVEGIEFADDRVGYAATAGHGVWRTTDGGITWAREVSTQDVFGIAIGGLAVADPDHALAGGRNAVIRREP